ncbi:TetR/AcrR family transcriptional regulator [Vreelandella utahensis]|uniref:TetR/AcrR family transcriptional regulator n=1 Tax=Vreelandella halophila TaxID=86177 RepID=UPI00098765D7|nr:TetR/AcrR family transcriptional regulator [Halomonas utahensis]
MSEPQEQLTPAAERILEAASDLFYWHGIRAVGMEAIAKAAGVTKKTIFDRFGSKDTLIVEYLRRRDRRWRRRMLEVLDQVSEEHPEHKLLATFDALSAWVRDENPRGCAFINAYSEIGDREHPAMDVITGQKQWLIGLLRELADAAGARDPEALTSKLMVLHEGITVMNSIQLSADPIGAGRDAAVTVIRAELPDASAF